MEEDDKAIELKDLYQQVADMTKSECASCLRPYSCCDPFYCEAAAEFTKTFWQEKLKPTGHPKLPFMALDNSGCVLPPHFRPMCTMHTCNINSFGYKPGDKEWTNRYYELRDKINSIEFVRTRKSRGGKRPKVQ